jgi:hypothetical protein
MIRYIVSSVAFIFILIAAACTVGALLEAWDFIRMAFLGLPSAMHPGSQVTPLHLALSTAVLIVSAAIHARFAFILVVPSDPDLFKRKMELTPIDQAAAAAA